MPKRTSPRQSFPVSPRSARLGSASPDFSDTPEAAEITRLVQMLNIDGTTQNPFEGTQTANTSANGNRLSAHRSRQWGRVLPGVCIRGHLRENESSRAPSPESLRRARPYDRLTQATHPYAFVGRPSARFNNPNPSTPVPVEPVEQPQEDTDHNESQRVPEPPWMIQSILPVISSVEAITNQLENLSFIYPPVPLPATAHSGSSYQNTGADLATSSSPFSDYSYADCFTAPAAEEATEGVYDMNQLEEALEECTDTPEHEPSLERDGFPSSGVNTRLRNGRTWNGGNPSLSPYAPGPPALSGRVKKEKRSKTGGGPYSIDKAARVKCQTTGDANRQKKRRRVRIEVPLYKEKSADDLPILPNHTPLGRIGMTVQIDTPPFDNLDFPFLGHSMWDHPAHDPHFPESHYPHYGF